MHGYAIAEHIEQLSENVLKVGEGSLYPALHRMDEASWIRSEWAPADNNRRARYYKITSAGRSGSTDQSGTSRTFGAMPPGRHTGS